MEIPYLLLTTDASNMGWEAVCGNNSTGGLWSLEEQRNHINYLELKETRQNQMFLVTGGL